MIDRYPIPPNYNVEIDNAATVHVWLESQGCTPHHVSVVSVEDTIQLEIESEIDPTTILETFPVTEPPTPANDLTDLMAEMQSVQQKLDALLAAINQGV